VIEALVVSGSKSVVRIGAWGQRALGQWRAIPGRQERHRIMIN
jgi:hypothetical protein